MDGMFLTLYLVTMLWVAIKIKISKEHNCLQISNACPVLLRVLKHKILWEKTCAVKYKYYLSYANIGNHYP